MSATLGSNDGRVNHRQRLRQFSGSRRLQQLRRKSEGRMAKLETIPNDKSRLKDSVGLAGGLFCLFGF
jgi:hypothetical protein